MEAVHLDVIDLSVNNTLASVNFDGKTAASTEPAISGRYASGRLQFKMTDIAGNEYSYTNDGFWDLAGQKIAINNTTQTTAPDIAVSPLISYDMHANKVLDLSSLLASNPQIGDTMAYNEVNMTNAEAQNLSIHLSDLLQLGTINSFDTTTYANDIQLRVRGDNKDTVTLDSAFTKAGNTPLSMGGYAYDVYTALNGTVDLFIQQGIVIA